jgi:glyoxylase-like metal-dependent hydrolase (beta-lactamase superfamily II)/rhodanese-related sulfurtransferase
MNILPFVHEGLGNSSYLVGLDDGRAIAIDPDRSVNRYLEAAEARGWRIETMFETHLHADFVTGARELLERRARLFTPEGAQSKLPHEPARAHSTIRLDGIEVEAIASPGHTPEHLSYVLRSGAQPPALFSGGSLIVGGAARTDLIAADMTEELTRALYRTLTSAFTALPDATALYPTHGGGSFCSASGNGERTSTLGAERRTNPALQIGSEEEFVRWFPSTFPAAPSYFFRMRAFNQLGPRLRREVPRPQPLSPEAFEEAMAMPGALVLDARSVEAYSPAHIRGSLHIPFRDSFAVWVGWLVPPDATLLLVADADSLDELVDECLLVGYERFGASLEGGIRAWSSSGRTTAAIEFIEGGVASEMIAEGAEVFDVREPDETAEGHVPGARLIPLGDLREAPGGDPGRPAVVYCAHGERASTGASILERAGRRSVASVRGGYEAITGQPEPAGVAPDSRRRNA